VSNDGSRIEAEEAAAHDDHHDGHDDDHGSHGGHGADPNAGVLVGDAPTPAWVGAATVICLVTALACVWLALKIG
jgi:hypothetical protein